MRKITQTYSTLAAILGAFMVFVYAGVGVIFLFLPNFIDTFKGTPRYLLGILLILYSAFRFYRIYEKWRERDDEV